MSQIMSRRDLEFLLFEWLDTERLFERKRYAEHSRDVVEDLLGLAERIATDHFAPHNRAADLAEPRFDGERVELVPEVEPALRAFADAGFLAAPLSEEAGGLQLPSSVFGACMAWFHAANVGTAGYALLTLANANLLTVHATPELVGRFVEPMTTGRFFGTMALSEPHAGSNLADITTRAEPQPDGTYRLFGRKMWISGGDHEMGDNIVHLVLARTPDAPLGTRGISLFLVPKYLVDEDGTVGERNDVVLAGINHKMGFRGTVNTAPIFGDGAFTPGGRPGAVGHLVGTEHRGLPVMFTMMNEARIGVGLGATALGYTGYLKSLAYARERLQGRPLGASPESPQVPLVEHPDVRRMLLAQKSYVEGALALNLYCSRLVDDIASLDDADVTAEAEKLLGRPHPDRQELAVAVVPGRQRPGHPGARRRRLHPRPRRRAALPRQPAQRDPRGHPRHPGRSTSSVARCCWTPVPGWRLLVGRMHGDRASRRRHRGRGRRAVRRAAHARGRPARRGHRCDRRAAVTSRPMLADATAYLEATGHLVVAWLWLEQWLVADGKEGAFYDGKRAATAYFFGRELPKVGPHARPAGVRRPHHAGPRPRRPVTGRGSGRT